MWGFKGLGLSGISGFLGFRLPRAFRFWGFGFLSLGCFFSGSGSCNFFWGSLRFLRLFRVCLHACLLAVLPYKRRNNKIKTNNPESMSGEKHTDPPQHSPARAPELSECWKHRVAGRLGHLASAACIGPWRCKKLPNWQFSILFPQNVSTYPTITVSLSFVVFRPKTKSKTVEARIKCPCKPHAAVPPFDDADSAS